MCGTPCTACVSRGIQKINANCKNIARKSKCIYHKFKFQIQIQISSKDARCAAYCASRCAAQRASASPGACSFCMAWGSVSLGGGQGLSPHVAPAPGRRLRLRGRAGGRDRRQRAAARPFRHPGRLPRPAVGAGSAAVLFPVVFGAARPLVFVEKARLLGVRAVYSFRSGVPSRGQTSIKKNLTNK